MNLFTTIATDGVKTSVHLHSAVQKTSQGIGNPDNWRNNRPTSGFFHGEHENAQHGRFLTGCVGTSQDVPVPIAGFPTRHSLQPSIGKEGSRVSTCQLEAIMPNLTKGNHARKPITSGASTTSLNHHQKAHEHISRAQVLLASGNAQLALGQLMVATRSLKQVCGGDHV